MHTKHISLEQVNLRFALLFFVSFFLFLPHLIDWPSGQLATRATGSKTIRRKCAEGAEATLRALLTVIRQGRKGHRDTDQVKEREREATGAAISFFPPHSLTHSLNLLICHSREMQKRRMRRRRR